MPNISLPDALHAAAEEWAGQAGFASAGMADGLRYR